MSSFTACKMTYTPHILSLNSLSHIRVGTKIPYAAAPPLLILSLSFVRAGTKTRPYSQLPNSPFPSEEHP
ncbi:MAG: hypothetical protein IKR71_09845 [Bacteroidales bacterium]|nr:hypothetical protein [Bacteroidales bacterium]